MTWLGLRLATGSGRGELLRAGLVALGAVLATVLLLCASLVLSIADDDCSDGCTRGTLYRTDLLDQAGLRPGVVTGLLLMLVPVLVFLGMCARISAAQRDRRLSAIRLAGATPGQVRALAGLESALPAAAGAVVGLIVVTVAKAVLERQYLASQVSGGIGAPRALPTDVALPLVGTALVLLLVPALTGLSAVLALRRVETTPLGVVRHTRPAPRAGAFPLLLVGLVLVLLAPLAGGSLTLLLMAGGALLTMLALTASSSWLAARVGALTAGRTSRTDLLLAGRRLQADPRAQGRALSGVVLAVFVASAAASLRADVLVSSTSNDDFYRSAYDLVDLAVLVALVVAAAGLCVAACEAVLERRRTLAQLVAGGVPAWTLRRAVVLQSVLPALPATLLAAAAGTVAAQVLLSSSGSAYEVPAARLLAVLGVALLAVTLSTALSLPLLSRATAPSELRQA